MGNEGQSPIRVRVARALPTFLSDVKARHDKMVELVTRMMELKKQQARAPKKQSPSARQLLDQKLAITDGQIDRLVYELYGLSDHEIRVVEDADRAKLYGAVSREP
jgi:hypothetical protein